MLFPASISQFFSHLILPNDCVSLFNNREEEDEWRLRLEENGGGNRFCDCVPGEENSSREEKEDGFDGGVLFI